MRTETHILSATLCSLLLFGCGGKGPQEAATAQKYCLSASMKERVELHTVGTAPVTRSIALTGNITYNPDRLVSFVPLVRGVIVSTTFSLGEKVTQGQVLATMRSTDLSQLQSEKQSLRSQVKVAERQLESVRSMHSDGIASQRDLMEAESGLEVLQAELNKVLTDLRMYSASDEDGVFELRAPASGIIVSKTITPGSQVAAEGEPLFTVSDLSEVWVNLNIYAGHVAHVKEGMEAGIVTLAYPGEVFSGRISAIAQVFDNDERVLKARVVLPNPGMRLKPGMLVDVKVRQQTGGEALAVPSGALVFDNDRHFLISHHDDCDLRVRAVKVLSKDNGTSFVTGDIAAGDRIITRNQLIIYEQVKGE